MKCTINKMAAKVINDVLASEQGKGKMVRVAVTHKHADHAHYELGLDVKGEHDEVVETESGIQVLLDSREELLDGVSVQYMRIPTEGFVITNKSKGNDGSH
jgi:Fe-S cluster assembly iron-binding protein IscA